MKKLLFLLIIVVSLFSFTNVSAEELDYDTLVLNMIEHVSSQESSYDFSDYPFFIKRNTSGTILSMYFPKYENNFLGMIYKDSLYYFNYSTSSNYYISYTYTISTSKYSRSSGQHTSNLALVLNSTYDILLCTSIDVYTDETKTDIYFAKNYPKQEEVEPTPTTSPEPTTSPTPTDSPEIDTSELEKCDSFVCDITDSILDGVDNDRFPFIKTIFHYLLILVFVFTVISPFLIIKWFLGRWF